MSFAATGDLAAPAAPADVGARAHGGKFGRVMHEFKHGELHSGSKHGPLVTSRDQAIAIAYAEERAAARRHRGSRHRG